MPNLTNEQREALAAAVDRVLMPLMRGVIVEKLSQVAAVMRDELIGPTLGGGKLEAVDPNHRADLAYILDTLCEVRPVLKNEPLRERVTAAINGMTYIIDRTRRAASGVKPDRCPHGVRYPHPCRECEDAPLPSGVPASSNDQQENSR